MASEATPTIRRVSQVAGHSSSCIWSQVMPPPLAVEHLDLESLLAQVADRDDVVLVSAGQFDPHPADHPVGDGLHRGTQDVDVDLVGAGELGHERLGGRVALEGDLQDGPAGVAGGELAEREEVAGQPGAAGGEQVGELPGLDDPAAAHQGRGVADRLDDVHLVGDQQHGEAELAVEVAQQGQDRPGGLRVEGAGGLVGEQHLGVAGQGAGDADALLLAAGELAGVAAGPVGEADQVEQFGGLAAALGAVQADDLQRQFDVLLGGARGEQVEVLEDHADPAAGLAQFASGAVLAAGQRGQFDAVHGDAAGGGPLQHVHAADEGGLAGTAGADDSVDLARTDVQVDAVEGGDLSAAGTVDLREVLGGDHGCFP
ncbi:hypothetical protein GCM10025734_68890 [Kitasatospora paranensis]